MSVLRQALGKRQGWEHWQTKADSGNGKPEVDSTVHAFTVDRQPG
jgi:hypothetical protein